jgi:pilus assembly protein CpaF
VFSPDGRGFAMPHVLPQEYRALAAHGFDLAGYLATQSVEVRP